MNGLLYVQRILTVVKYAEDFKLKHDKLLICNAGKATPCLCRWWWRSQDMVDNIVIVDEEKYILMYTKT
mgnify:CR=1 FL=1